MKSKKIAIIILTIILLSILLIYFNNVSKQPMPLHLSEEEKTFIKNHPVITLAPDPNFAPVEFFDESGDFKGIVSDYIDYINKNSDLNIQIIRYDSWDSIIDAIEVKEVDMLGGVSKSQRREKFLTFSRSYMDIPNVFVSRKENIEINDETIPQLTIGVTNGSANQDLLKQYYPKANIILVENIQEGLKKVSIGHLDVFLGSSGQITYYIDYYKYTNLSIIKETEYSYPIHFAVRKDYKVLKNIINKILVFMPEATEQAIYDKWIGLDSTNYFVSKDFFVKLIIGFSAVLIISFLIIRFLKFEVNRQTKEMIELNSHLEKALSESRKMSHEIALSMINLVEIHDNYTRGHSQHVADYTRQIVEAMGFTGKELDQAYYSALLHDLGKALISHNIISKKGRLTEKEYDEIKKHPFFGYEVLKNMESFEEIATNILFHHERIDGNGYPKGIQGSDIPLVSRIISVVDAFDAMTTKRSYKSKISVKEAIIELKENAGTQFDSVIVEKFIEIYQEKENKTEQMTSEENIN